MYCVLSVLSEMETGNQLVNLLEELETGEGGSVQDMRVQWGESEAVLGRLDQRFRNLPSTIIEFLHALLRLCPFRSIP